MSEGKQIDESRITVRKVPTNKPAPFGRFWAEVDDVPVSVGGQVYWRERQQAFDAARIWLAHNP